MGYRPKNGKALWLLHETSENRPSLSEAEQNITTLMEFFWTLFAFIEQTAERISIL